jgi:hypothetical protein
VVFEENSKNNLEPEPQTQTAAMSIDASSLTVHLRVRPLSTKENANPDAANIVRCLHDTVLVDATVRTNSDPTAKRFMGAKTAVPRAAKFQFASVLPSRSTQSDVFDAVASTILGGFDGCNGAVFAYGATGSGKTYTMMGDDLSDEGVMPRAADLLFKRKNELESIGKVVTLELSYYEIYNENVFNLAVRTKQQRQLAVRETPAGGCDIPLLTHYAPQNAEQFRQWLDKGNANRVAEETFANEKSSRSHAILCVDMTVRDEGCAEGRFARLKFCDLAGSERAAATNNSGMRFREGANINRSLLALGAVVSALAKRSAARTDEARDKVFIPFRGSKLTRLLKDCLGGNCKPVMIVCISPASTSVEETLNTLHYASTAQRIQMSAVRNEFAVDPDASGVAEEAISRLNAENAALRMRLQAIADGAAIERTDSLMVQPESEPVLLDVSTDCAGLASADTLGALPISSEMLSPKRASPSPPRSQYFPAPHAELPDAGKLEGYTTRFDELRKQQDTVGDELKSVDDRREIVLETLVREKTMTVAKHRAQKFLAGAPDDNNATLPVFIAGAMANIEHHQQERKDNAGKRQELSLRLEDISRGLAELHRQVKNDNEVREFQPLLHAFETMRLRINGAEAEGLAGQYYQSAFRQEQRVAESRVAIEKCMDVIARFAKQSQQPGQPPAGGDAQLQLDAREALAYCTLPFAETEDMLRSFDGKLNSAAMSRKESSLPALSYRASVKLELLNAPRSARSRAGLTRHAAANNKRPDQLNDSSGTISPTVAQANINTRPLGAALKGKAFMRVGNAGAKKEAAFRDPTTHVTMMAPPAPGRQVRVRSPQTVLRKHAHTGDARSASATLTSFFSRSQTATTSPAAPTGTARGKEEQAQLAAIGRAASPVSGLFSMTPAAFARSITNTTTKKALGGKENGTRF